jgi:hypothetical protein
MSLKTIAYKIYLLAWAVCCAVWFLHSSSKMAAHHRRFTEAVGILLLFYFVPQAIFEARAEAAEDGLHVEQYGKALISYSEIRRCFSFYLFPFQIVIVMTKRKFPLNILITGDKLATRRRSLLQDGELASRIKSKML